MPFLLFDYALQLYDVLVEGGRLLLLHFLHPCKGASLVQVVSLRSFTGLCRGVEMEVVHSVFQIDDNLLE